MQQCIKVAEPNYRCSRAANKKNHANVSHAQLFLKMLERIKQLRTFIQSAVAKIHPAKNGLRKLDPEKKALKYLREKIFVFPQQGLDI